MSKSLIIGHDKFRYRVNARWGDLNPAYHPVQDCHGLVMDRRGRILLLTNDTRNNVLIYNKDGHLLDAWGRSYPGAHGLTLSDEGGDEFLYITDVERHQVIKTTLKGQQIMTLDYPVASGLYQSACEFKPTETAVNPANGDIYVTDGYGWQTVTRFTAQGEYVQHWGGWPSRKWPQEMEEDRGMPFYCAHGIALDLRPSGQHENKPTLLISSRNHNCFRRYTLEGQPLDSIPLPGSFVCRPVIHGENLYAAVFRSVTNQTPHSGYIQVLDQSNRVVATPGGTEPVYDEMGSLQKQCRTVNSPFLHPHDVCVDADENLYVAQWNSAQTYPIKLERVA